MLHSVLFFYRTKRSAFKLSCNLNGHPNFYLNVAYLRHFFFFFFSPAKEANFFFGCLKQASVISFFPQFPLPR